MSLVGKKVTVVVRRSQFESEDIDGVVLDKYLGTSIKRDTTASGRGGTMSIDRRIGVEFYIVKTPRRIIHVECSSIIKVED